MYDALIIGGGIVGLSSAWQLQQRFPQWKILLLEKEEALARHQSGRNSGVVHAGIYYEPDSLKARFCKEGVEATRQFCREHGVAFERTGKLVVATSDSELPRLRELHQRALRNGLQATLLDGPQLVEREPRVRGVGAIHLQTTGITDYPAICERLASLFTALGGELRLGAEAAALAERPDAVTVETRGGESFQTRFLLCSGGLAADRLARRMGMDIDFRVIPYRGEYYRLAGRLNGIVRQLIYPVPDPALPFLGVHLTRTVDGAVTVGPNAVQGWKREGYGRLNFDARDSWEILSWPGFWRLSARHLGQGFRELRNSLWKRAYLEQVRRYCPEVGLDDLRPHPAGVRAQVVLRDGTMVHDFLFARSRRSLHVCNAPSPAATSALPIGRHVAGQVAGQMEEMAA